MSLHPATASWPVCLLLVAAGAGLICAPQTIQNRVGGLVRDAIVPGQRLAQMIAERVWSGRKGQEITREAMAAQREQAWSLEVARLRRELDDLEQVNRGTGSGSGSDNANSPALLTSDTVTARVLRGFAAARWRGLATIDSGRGAGIVEEALVLDGDLPLIDVGAPQGISSRQLLTAGRAVVGQVIHAGRYSSTVRPITDLEFRAGVRLARRSPAGLSFGAVGTLKGTGSEVCDLVRILPTEPVEAGDLVISLANETGVIAPLLFGVVEEASLPENGLEWTIRVRPTVLLDEVERVGVIRLEMDSSRVLAN
jgi:cell shape-determining protein MreC